jgi:hypothetical protein
VSDLPAGVSGGTIRPVRRRSGPCHESVTVERAGTARGADESTWQRKSVSGDRDTTSTRTNLPGSATGGLARSVWQLRRRKAAATKRPPRSGPAAAKRANRPGRREAAAAKRPGPPRSGRREAPRAAAKRPGPPRSGRRGRREAAWEGRDRHDTSTGSVTVSAWWDQGPGPQAAAGRGCQRPVRRRRPGAAGASGLAGPEAASSALPVSSTGASLPERSEMRGEELESKAVGLRVGPGPAGNHTQQAEVRVTGTVTSGRLGHVI